MSVTQRVFHPRCAHAYTVANRCSAESVRHQVFLFCSFNNRVGQFAETEIARRDRAVTVRHADDRFVDVGAPVNPTSRNMAWLGVRSTLAVVDLERLLFGISKSGLRGYAHLFAEKLCFSSNGRRSRERQSYQKISS